MSTICSMLEGSPGVPGRFQNGGSWAIDGPSQGGEAD